MKKPYKVESKGSLFEVTFEYGEYSEWDIQHYIFSGNTADEVWEAVKIWAKNGGFDYNWKNGLVWEEGNKKYKIADDDIDWSTAYGDAYLVKIKRAEVIYISRMIDKLEPDFEENKQ